ncbi:unnamed protein product [Chilo suppressalis]|uniref:Helicase POLQ-like n=1 Tax=Chilo suppressalis TaxID=168631 RepID=A0ABN8APF4_CHISP|nr:unnamed protein product [Chilo suppressalis]
MSKTNMDSKNIQEHTSTPKRRRLGTGRILRQCLKLNNKENNNSSTPTFSPIHCQITSTKVSSLERCESPPLPSNQDEFLHDSRNSSSACYIPSSPAIIENSQNKSNPWESLSTCDLGDICSSRIQTNNVENELKDISDDMFHSRMEEPTQACEQQIDNHEIYQSPLEMECMSHDKSCQPLRNERSFVIGQAILDLKTEFQVVHKLIDSKFTMGCEKLLIENVEESFELVNQSICGIEHDKKSVKSTMFETKDSFLLDMKESGIVAQNNQCFESIVKQKSPVKASCNQNNFYDLPMITKSLFKMYRNIDKFYDWQEECLNLPAIKERRNLIYALPTSGGKTLVAEVLMLREVLNRNKNALFILPFVAIVQEKIWSLSPFALSLDFLVEEYAGGKGLLPPKKRRKKKSIYIATIEKGLGLVRSLIELDRLDELGLIVVDELHLIGEQGRGAALETLLTTILFADKGIQIVGMSATIGNLPQLAQYLRAEVFERQFRPVELTEYVKLGDMLHRMLWTPDGLQIVPDRQLAYDYSSAATSLDPDWLGGLVSEVVPGGSCLVFCPTKRSCENVASLLAKLQRREMCSHRTRERVALEKALLSEGASAELARLVRYGIAFHHAGLANDERAMLEQAFRSGVISVLCCTSTLAAGVNLPARRVIVRAPHVGRSLITLAAYRQMAGRAGRAGVCEAGESIIMCGAGEWARLRTVLEGGVGAASSQLGGALPALMLSAAALRLAADPLKLRRLLASTLLATSPGVNLEELYEESMKSLIQSGAIEVVRNNHQNSNKENDVSDCSEFIVSKLGVAAMKGGMDLSTAKRFLSEVEVASRSLVLMGGLHLLYLVTADPGVKPDYRHYYSLYNSLDEEGMRTAKVLGITEVNAIRMMTGKPITNIPESVLCRFYFALMLRDLCREMPFSAVADKYCLARGTVQSVLSSASAFASCGQRFCQELKLGWFPALLQELAPRLQHCAAPALHDLMQLPSVKKARAMQLMRVGYKRIEDLAKASADDLIGSVDHLTRTTATHLISAARLILIEKVENLRAEAEDVMEDLKV